jgi:hypothetical protein
MSYTLGQAARATGKTKPTIARAIKIGRLSASRADDGSYLIDPAELHRVYPVAGNANGQTQRSDTPAEGNGILAASPAEVEGLRRLLAEREARIADKDSVIADLRDRLDRADQRVAEEISERRRLLALLTDQRTRAWWRRWFR